MTGFEVIQTKEPCAGCHRPILEGEPYRMRLFDLRRKGWSKFNRKLKADHTMQLIAHVVCERNALREIRGGR